MGANSSLKNASGSMEEHLFNVLFVRVGVGCVGLFNIVCLWDCRFISTNVIFLITLGCSHKIMLCLNSFGLCGGVRKGKKDRGSLINPS